MKNKEKEKVRMCDLGKNKESDVHRGELGKCGKEKKHDQSSRSSVTTVKHTKSSSKGKRERGM